MDRSWQQVSVREIRPGAHVSGARKLPVETPVSLEFNGIGYAVMMATPLDLEDFATGFALSEQIVRSVSEISSVSPVETENGWIIRIQIASLHTGRLLERVRVRASDSSCGLCGLESLEQVMRPLPRISAELDVRDEALFKALEGLSHHQPLNRETGGVHAAAFCAPGGEIVCVREDVGRHNALDKLIGALANSATPAESGFILVSSRCSYELVEKTVLSGCPVLVAISTATTLAAERAHQAGLRLVALARPDSMLEVIPPG